MNVDLPEPDGPIITTTSPFFTDVVMPRSAWKLPNHLCTSRQTMISSSITVCPFVLMLDAPLGWFGLAVTASPLRAF